MEAPCLLCDLSDSRTLNSVFLVEDLASYVAKAKEENKLKALVRCDCISVVKKACKAFVRQQQIVEMAIWPGSDCSRNQIDASTATMQDRYLSPMPRPSLK